MSDLLFQCECSSPVRAQISLPPSKSLLIRRLLIAGVAGYPVPALGGSTDVSCVARVLRRGIPTDQAVVDVADAGAAMRFLAALYAATPGADLLLTGTERMQQRPIAPLVDALRSMGADVEYAGRSGFPPLRISGRELRGGEVGIDASLSSQFVSAIMMIAPKCAAPVLIRLDGDVASLPYIQMTLAEMQRCGVRGVFDGRTVSIEPGGYSLAPQFDISDGDWSAAAFILEALSLLPPGSEAAISQLCLTQASEQGDAAAVGYFRKLGIEVVEGEGGVTAGRVAAVSPEPIVADMRHTPDMVPALAVAAAAAGVPFLLTGVKSLRHKECDRLEALRIEGARFGFDFRVEPDAISSDSKRAAVAGIPAVDPHNDHRIAMAFASATPALGPLVVRDFEVVAKSFPDAAAQLRQLGIESSPISNL